MAWTLDSIMWTPENSLGEEARKIKWELVPYFRGRVLDIGCGGTKAFPHFTGVDSGKAWGRAAADLLVSDAQYLPMVGSGAADMVFSSHLLEHIEYERVPAVLAEWCRVTRKGGHVVLYLPDEDTYPKVGEIGANVDHRWNVNYDKVVAAMDAVERDWDLIDYQKRDEGNEYSLFFVFRMDS